MNNLKTVLKLSLILSCLWIFSNKTFAQGNALGLDGNNDYVDCGTDASLNISGTAITLEAWIYPTSFQPNVWQGNIVNRDIGPSSRGYMIRVGATGQVNFNIGNGGWNEINSPINAVSLNTWHHIAATYDGSTMRLYVDGVQVATGALTGNIGATANASLLLGDDPGFTGRYFPGKIDEVRIWNTTRSPQEIMDDMNQTSCAPFPTGLIAYYKFNQGIANANNAGLNTVIDELGNNNGTLINSSLNGPVSNWVEGIPLSVSDSALTICQGDSILIGGSYQTTAGTFFDSLQTTTGCDSLIRITLTVTPSVTATNMISICQGDSLLLGGSFQTVSGVYTDTFQAASGCDSILSTTLIVLVPANITMNTQICQGDSILLAGAYQTTAGSYSDSLQNMMGCDSVIFTTNLSILSPVLSSDTLSICQGDSILLAGAYQTTTGIYSDTLQSSIGCDSIHQQTLLINALPNVTLTPFSPDTLCDNGAPIPLPSAMPLGGTYSGNGVSGTDFDPTLSGPGMHYVVYSFSDLNNCTNIDSTMITVNICLGLEAIVADLDLNIFPNPVQDIITIQNKATSTDPINIKVVNALGKTVKNTWLKNNTSSISLDLSDLNNGVYFMLISNKKHSIVRKISKYKS